MKKNKFTVDDLSYGSDLDLDFHDFGVTGDQVKDDRHPISKFAAAVAKGGKEYGSDPANYERIIKQSLPKGYGDAINVFNEGNKELRGLYNNVADELRPAINSMRQATSKFLPKIEKSAPKFVSKAAKRFADGATNQNYGGGRDYREDDMRRIMDSIFAATADQRAQEEKREDAKETVKQATEQIRHRDIAIQLDAIRQATQSSSKYNTSIGYAATKQSLELGFRSYWVLADLLKETRANNKILQMQNKAIIKNTGLPDFVKTTASERFSEIVRNRFLDTARDSMFSGTRDYIRRFSGNLQKQALQKLSPMAQSASMAAQMAAMGAEFDDGSGPSFMETLTKAGTKMALDVGMDAASKRFKKVSSGSSKARRMGARAGYEAGKVGDTIYDTLNDPGKSWWGPLELLRNALADASPSRQAESTMETDKFGRLNRPTPFTAQTAKSINEVIPGFLSHIHRELKMLRTGDKVNDLLTYDFTKNQFGSERATGDAIKSLFGGANSKSFTQSADNIIGMIDKNGKLSESQRQIIRKKIMERITTGESLDSTRSTKSYTWGGGDDGDAIASAFQRHLRTNDGDITRNEQSMKRQGLINEEYNRIASGAIDPRAMVQTLVNMGQRESLVRAGILNDKNQINRETLATLMAGGSVDHKGYEDDSKVRQWGNVRGGGGPGVSTKDLDIALKKAQVGSRVGLTSLSESVERLGAMPSTTDAFSGKEQSDQTTRLTSIDSTLLRIEKIMSTGTSANLDALWEIYKSQNAAATTNASSGGFMDRFRRKNSATDDGEEESEEGDGSQPRAKSFTSLWQHAMSSGKDTATDIIKKAKKYGRPVMNRLDVAASKFKKFTGDLGQKLSFKYGDIRMPGEAKARLTTGGLKAGLYFDRASGQMLTSLEDIHGEVMDAFGNTILRADEIQDAFVSGSLNQKLTGILDNVTTNALDLLGRARTFIPQQVQTVINNAKKVVNLVKEKLPPFDVYVADNMKEPILYANLMRYDKYYSRKTSKVIKHPRDIDGEVVDSDGNIVVREDQIKIGLVDKDGVGIHNVAGRMLGKIGRKLASGVSLLAGLGTNAVGSVMEHLKKFNALIADAFVPFKDIMVNSARTVTALYEIYDLLNERLPGNPKVRGDVDGDGVRDGSAKDVREKVENQKKEKEQQDRDKAAANNQASSKGLLGGILSGLAGLGKGKADGGEDGGDTNVYGGSIDAGGDKDKKDGKKDKDKAGNQKGGKGGASKAGNAGKAAGKVGKMGRVLGWGGKAISGIGSIAKAVLTPSTLLTSVLFGGLKLGASGLGMLASGAGALASGAAAAAPTIGAAASAIFSWPVAAAVGVGVTGYGLYKWGKRTKLTNLSKIRVVQYGAKADNEEEAKRFFAFEAMHTKGTTVSEDGLVKFDAKSIDPKEAFDLFEITNRRALSIFERWYKGRFMPVYRKHIQALWKYKKSVPLKEVEDVVPDNKKQEYVDATVGGMESFHDAMTGWNARWEVAQTNNNDVVNIVNATRAVLAKASDKVTGDKTKAVLNETVASLGDKAPETLARKAVNREAGYVARDKDGNDLSELSVGELTEKIKKGEATVTVAVATPPNLLHVETNRLDALTTIRFKAYGLDAMVYAKVRALGALEMLVEKNCTTTKAGVELRMPATKILEVAGVAFGVPSINGAHGRDWISWFNGRFLPVFLTYTSSVRKLTKKESNVEAVKALPIVKQLEIARALIGVDGVGADGTKRTVWSNPTSPWSDGVELNSNPDSTASNLETIRVLADKIVLQEPLSTTVSADQQRKNSDPTKAAFGMYAGFNRRGRNTSAQGGFDQTAKYGIGVGASGDMIAGAIGSGGQMGSAAGVAAANSSAVKNSVGSISNAAAGGPPAGFTGNSSKVSADGGSSLAGMAEGFELTNGNGGQYSQMDPGNADGWAALKKTIFQAAGIVGVDPKVLSAMIAIESSFRRGAKPYRKGKLMSSAEGLGQFLDKTWNAMMAKYGKKFGIPPGTPKSDARASALMTAAYIKDNLSGAKYLRRKPTATDAYILHFFGPGDGATFLKASANDIAASVVPTPAQQHPEYFYDNGRARTVKEVYQILTDKMANTGKRFGVNESDFVKGATDTGLAAVGTNPTANPSNPASGAGGAAGAAGAGGLMGPPAPEGGSGALKKDAAAQAAAGANGAPGTPGAGGNLVPKTPEAAPAPSASAAKASIEVAKLKNEKSLDFAPVAGPRTTKEVSLTSSANNSSNYITPTKAAPAEAAPTRAAIAVRSNQTNEERNMKAQEEASRAMPLTKDILDVLKDSNGQHKEVVANLKKILELMGTKPSQSQQPAQAAPPAQKLKPQVNDRGPVPMSRMT